MKFLIILFALVASTFAGFPLAYVGSPLYSTLYGQHLYRTNGFGQYSYGYAGPEVITKGEARGADGSVAGGYAYAAPTGQQVQVSYTAGEEFKPTGEVAVVETVKKPEETEEKKTVFVSPLHYGYPHYYNYYNSYPFGYQFPVVPYKTVVPVTEVKPTVHQTYSYASSS